MATDLDREIEDFVADNVMRKNLDRRTATDYAREVRYFAQYLATDGEPSDVVLRKLRNAEARDIRRFFVSRNLKTPERNKYALKSYYTYVCHLGERRDNPASELSFEPKKKEPISVLEREEVRRLLETPHSRDAIRDKAILHFFYSGPKRKEVGEVLANDFDLGRQQITVNGRVIPLKQDAAQAIADYLRVRPDSDQEALFLSRRDSPMTERQAWVILKDCAAEAGLPAKTAFERLRKSYTVHALQDGVNVLEVLNARGSDNPQSIYEEMKLAYGEQRNAPNLLGEGISDETFDALDMENIREAWHEITALLGTKPDGALRATLVLLDSVSELILTAHNVKFSKQDNPGWKCKQALSLVLPYADAENEFFKAFTKSTASIVDNIGQYRGLRSDAHATASERAVAQYEAEFAANLARATVAFMVQCYRVKRASEAGKSVAESASRRKTKISFTVLQADALAAAVSRALKRATDESRPTLQRLLKDVQKARSAWPSKIRISFSLNEVQEVYAAVQSFSPATNRDGAALKQVLTKLGHIKLSAFQEGNV